MLTDIRCAARMIPTSLIGSNRTSPVEQAHDEKTNDIGHFLLRS